MKRQHSQTNMICDGIHEPPIVGVLARITPLSASANRNRPHLVPPLNCLHPSLFNHIGSSIMDAAASVVGLLAAGGKLYTTLERLISTFTDAPLVAHTTCNEVRDFRYALSKLQPYIEGSAPIKLLGASMIDVHHLSLTLGASVFTFSRLEKKLGRLIAWDQLEKPDERLVARSMDTLSRLRWLRGEGDISLLVQNIQQHKSSLNLLLTVLMRFVFTFFHFSGISNHRSNTFFSSVRLCLRRKKAEHG